MSFFSSNAGYARSLALAGAVAAIMGASAVSPSYAGDDGQAPIWSGIGDLIGLTGIAGGKEKEAPIEYQERARLVLPPKMTLPPPVAPVTERTANWPLDPEIAKLRKEKADRLNMLRSQQDLQEMRDGHRLSPDKLRADRVMPGDAGPKSNCSLVTTNPSRNCNTTPFRNVLETIGLAKPDEVVAGQEPDRDWLTDPPKGYRMPTANTVAKTDAGDAKKPDDRDPRATLYHAPDTTN
ncbi:hypothetical protein [Methylocapsa sp. S129]|uniref:hypothetical protein n=1 Tax=Methylocapsa sp. S129 TaxID=1641869 RepID=UPI00131BE2BC|nr:hypothetical protein [Methylocapsa sp. S129]